MTRLYQSVFLITLLAASALFGFFYAWSVSAMWGLDAADPTVAIHAMNAVNSNVQNAFFALSFFGAPIMLLVCTVVAFLAGIRPQAMILAAAFLICVFGVHVVTFTQHIPLNRGLLGIGDFGQSEAGAIWQTYADPWKFWNWVRTIGSGGVVLLLGIAALGAGAGRTK